MLVDVLSCRITEVVVHVEMSDMVCNVYRKGRLLGTTGVRPAGVWGGH